MRNRALILGLNLLLVAVLLMGGCTSTQSEPAQIPDELTPSEPPASAPSSTSLPTPTPSPPTPAPVLSYSEIYSELSNSCPKLLFELERLPEIEDGVSEQDLEALNDIYSLYIKAENPEVKEAFVLMIEGGNPYEEIQKEKEIAANISIDGLASDWQGTEPVCIDNEGDSKSNISNTDIRAVYAVIDDKYLYIMWDIVDKPNLVEDIQYCFEVDVDGDGDPDYQPGFRTNGYTWLWDLRESNERKGSPIMNLEDAEVAAWQVIEFKLPLSYVGNSSSLAIIPFIWVSSENVTADMARGQVGSGYGYDGPQYNTGLQVLYWLAEQNEFKPDDTLAQAIAMVNGLWVTMGDNEVRRAVFKDTNNLLNYFRETNEIQKARGYPQLEEYPLEAKTCLGWTGGVSAHPVLNSLHNIVYEYKNKHRVLDLNAYQWNTVDVEKLREMRNIAEGKGWFKKDTFEVIDNYFLNNWDFYVDPTKFVEESLGKKIGRTIDVIGNVEIYLNYFLKNGKQIGNCADQMAFVDAWSKSLGIATNYVWRNNIRLVEEGISPNGHMFNCRYDPSANAWGVLAGQLDQWSPGEKEGDPNTLYIFRLPVNQITFWNIETLDKFVSTEYFTKLRIVKIENLKAVFSKGISTSHMKQWLLYSAPLSYQIPEFPSDESDVLVKIHHTSPMIVKVLQKYKLLIKDGVIDTNEERIILDVAGMFPAPDTYVANNTEEKASRLYDNGNTEIFFNKLATPHFNIYFNNSELEMMRDLIFIAEISYEKATSFFDFTPSEKIGIYLFENKDDRDKISRWEVHYPDIYIYSSKSYGSDEGYAHFVGHEITHMVEIAYLGRHWEWSWLNEGLADYIGGESFKYGGGVDGLKYYLETQELQHLKDMVSNDEWVSFIDREYGIVYHQAWSVIEFLVEEYGKDKVVALFDYSKVGDQPERALERALGIGMDELEDAWRAWIGAKYGI